MTLFPSHYETFVLARSSEKVMDQIMRSTTTKILLQNQEPGDFLFTGWAKADRFRISMKINRPNNYIPLVVGRAEKTSGGCLVFILYKLFPSTKIFLVSWSLFIAVAGSFAAYQYQSLIYGFAAFGLIIFINWVVWSNFKIQLRATRQVLLKILN